MSISDDLASAEIYLARAVGKLSKVAGTAQVMPSGRKWIGSLSEYRKAVRLMLTLRELERRVRRIETPKQQERNQ